MNKYDMAAQTIKDSISALDVGKAIGLDIDRHGRCACPFHNGKDRNLKLFDGNKGYHCFVCHAGGDVIKFVQEYYRIGFKEAIGWFNDTFCLGLDIEGRMSPDERRRAENSLQRQKNAIEEKRRIERMRFNLALAADKIVQRMEEIRDDNTPKTAEEPWSEDFTRAVECLPEARRFAEECMMNCTDDRTERKDQP